MKSPIEHLRDLSQKHRDRIAEAEKIAENMKKTAEAARQATREKESGKE